MTTIGDGGHNEPEGLTTAFVGKADEAVELRNRKEPDVRVPHDPEAPANPPRLSPDESSRRAIAKCSMRLDIMTYHTITEDYTIDDRLINLEPHFQFLWGIRVPTNLVLQWIDNKQLYSSPAIAPLPGFHEFVARLSPDRVNDLLGRADASLFYVRAVKSRIQKLEEQKTIIGLAEKDLRHAYEVNLGLLIDERPESVGDYVHELSHKRAVECDRLAGMLAQARRLRDLSTRAFRQGYLEENMVDGLRARVSSLNENYDEARELLGERNSKPLVDRTFEDWLPLQGVGPRRWRQLSPTHIACLTLLFSILAGYPAFRGLYNQPDQPGSLDDPAFWSLLSNTILQLLNLVTQLFAPRIWHVLFYGLRIRLRGDDIAREEEDIETIAWTWIIALLAFTFTGGSLAAYFLVSVQFSAWMAFAAQVFMGMVNLMLVYQD